MAVSGKIKTFPLTDLFQWISLSRKSGVLRISCGDYLIQVFFRKGVLVSATSTEPSRRLGQYLLARGFLDEERLRLALTRQEQTEGERLLGDVLQQLGLLDQGQIDRALRERAAELVYDLFLLEDGVFFFEEREGIPDNLVPINLNIDSLILEGVRRKDEWERIRQLLPDDTIRLRVVPKPKAPAGAPTELRRKILSLPDRDYSIGEIGMHTRRSAFDVYFEVFRMVKDGVSDRRAGGAGGASGAGRDRYPALRGRDPQPGEGVSLPERLGAAAGHAGEARQPRRPAGTGTLVAGP